MDYQNIQIENRNVDASQPAFFDIQLSSGYQLYVSIAEFNEKEFGPIVTEEEDLSEILLKNEDLRQSVIRAREQMRTGSRYFFHEEVFGE